MTKKMMVLTKAQIKKMMAKKMMIPKEKMTKAQTILEMTDKQQTKTTQEANK